MQKKWQWKKLIQPIMSVTNAIQFFILLKIQWTIYSLNHVIAMLLEESWTWKVIVESLLSMKNFIELCGDGLLIVGMMIWGMIWFASNYKKIKKISHIFFYLNIALFAIIPFELAFLVLYHASNIS